MTRSGRSRVARCQERGAGGGECRGIGLPAGRAGLLWSQHRCAATRRAIGVSRGASLMPFGPVVVAPVGEAAGAAASIPRWSWHTTGRARCP